MVFAMHMRNLICTLVLAAFVSGLSWALYRLDDLIGFWPFMLFGAVTIPLMVSCGYAYDYFERKRWPQSPRPTLSDRLPPPQ